MFRHNYVIGNIIFKKFNSTDVIEIELHIK